MLWEGSGLSHYLVDQLFNFHVPIVLVHLCPFCYLQTQILDACDAGHTHSVPGFLDKAMTHLICQCLDPDYRRRLSPMECLSLLVQSDVGKNFTIDYAILYLWHLVGLI